MLKLKNLKFIILIVSIITFVFLVNTCYAVDLNLSTDLTSNMSGNTVETNTNATDTDANVTNDAASNNTSNIASNSSNNTNTSNTNSSSNSTTNSSISNSTRDSSATVTNALPESDLGLANILNIL